MGLFSFLDPLTDVIGSAINSLTGAKESGGKQYQRQRELNEQQFEHQKALNVQTQEYNTLNARQQFGYQQQLNEQSFGYQTQLNDQATAAQKELFDYEAAYNSPAAQRQRMMQAGLNPNFSDGFQNVAMPSASPGGSVGAGSAGLPSAPTGSAQGGSAAVGSGQDILGLVEGIQRISQMSAVTKGIELDNKAKEAGLPKTGAETRLTNAQAQGQEIANQYAPQNNEAGIANKNAQTGLYQSQTEGQNITNEWSDYLNSAQVKSLMASAAFNNASEEEKLKMLEHNINLVKSQTYANFTHASYEKAQIQQGWAALKYKGQEVEISRGMLNEQIRHNKSVEDVERTLARSDAMAKAAQANFLKSQKTAQDLANYKQARIVEGYQYLYNTYGAESMKKGVAALLFKQWQDTVLGFDIDIRNKNYDLDKDLNDLNQKIDAIKLGYMMHSNDPMVKAGSTVAGMVAGGQIDIGQ